MNSQNKETSIQENEDLHRLEGLVIGLMDYRDQDAIVKVATDTELVSVLARGIQKEGSKNRRLCAPYSKIRFQYDPRYSHDMLYLITGSTIASYWACQSSLESQCICEICASLIQRHGVVPKGTQALEKQWQAWKEHDKAKAILWACCLVMLYLKETGVVMNVDECTVCQSKQHIAGVSLETGGFVCASHLGSHRPWPKKRLLQLRRLVRVPFDRVQELMNFDWDEEFFILLLEWYVYFNDARLKSFEFFKQLQGDKSSIQAKF